MLKSIWLTIFGAGLACWLMSDLALGQPRAVRHAEAAKPKSEEELLRRLSAKRTDPRGAIRQATLVLEEGGSKLVLLAAIEVAEDLGDERISPVLSPYAAHRNSDISSAALRALGRTGGDVAVKALRQGLRRREQKVRVAATDGLYRLHPREAWEDLWAAFQHGNLDASGAIGKTCRHEECREFAARSVHIPLNYRESALDGMLFRASDDVNDEDKIYIARMLWGQVTRELETYLSDVAKHLPEDTNPALLAALRGGWISR